MTAKEHRSRCQALRGGVTASEGLIIDDLERIEDRIKRLRDRLMRDKGTPDESWRPDSEFAGFLDALFVTARERPKDFIDQVVCTLMDVELQMAKARAYGPADKVIDAYKEQARRVIDVVLSVPTYGLGGEKSDQGRSE